MVSTEQANTSQLGYNDSVYMEAINLTISYNTNYTASIASINCAGESNSVLLHDILYSK